MSYLDVWATGLFEGEGCIYIHPQKKSVTLIIRSTDLDILQRIENLWGGNIKEHKQQANAAIKSRKTCWTWRIYKAANVRNLLETMLPLLGDRRACKAQDALDHLDGI